MSDDADISKEISDFLDNVAIKSVLSDLPKPLPENQRGKVIYRECNECGDLISQERIEAINSNLCQYCQSELERVNRLYPKRGYHHD